MCQVKLNLRIFPAPAPVNEDGILVVNMSLFIREISTIDEINGLIVTKVDFVKKWEDRRLKFKNLHQNKTNLVSEEDNERIWYPYFVFENIQNSDHVKKTDKPDLLKIIPNKNFQSRKASKV